MNVIRLLIPLQIIALSTAFLVTYWPAIKLLPRDRLVARRVASMISIGVFDQMVYFQTLDSNGNVFVVKTPERS